MERKTAKYGAKQRELVRVCRPAAQAIPVPGIDRQNLDYLPGLCHLKCERYSAEGDEQPSDAMQAKLGAGFDHAEAAYGGQKRICHDIVHEQIRVMAVCDGESRHRAEALSNGEYQPEHEQH